MGIQDQVSAMLHANIEDRLARVEDPEAQLNQISREIDGTLQRAAASIAEDLTELRRTRDTLEMVQYQVAAWEKQVASARSNQDAMAEHEAIGHLKRCRLDAQRYEELLDAQMHAVSQFITQRNSLRGKYHDLQDSRDVLIARARSNGPIPHEPAIPVTMPARMAPIPVQRETPSFQPRQSLAGAILQLVLSR